MKDPHLICNLNHSDLLPWNQLQTLRYFAKLSTMYNQITWPQPTVSKSVSKT